MAPENDDQARQLFEDVASPQVEYHAKSDTFRTEFDNHTRPASEAIIAAVAEATERDEVDLPKLYSIVDPDALDALFGSLSVDGSRSEGALTIDYGGCRVTIKSHGTILVRPIHQGEDV